MARAAPRRDCGREGTLSCCVGAALLLLGAEKAESVAGRKEVVQDRRDRVGFVWGSAARWVLLLWGRGVCVGAAPSPRWGPLGIPGSTGLLSPAALPLRGKNAQTPFSTSQMCSYAGILGRTFPQLCPRGCVWLGRRGVVGGLSPTCDGCQMCWLVSGCLPAPWGRGGGWRADGGEITPPRHSDKDDPALRLIKRLILEFEIGI